MNTHSLQIHISDIDCPSCAQTIAQNLKAIDGVVDVVIDSLSGNARISYDSEKISQTRITTAVETLGYTVMPAGIARCVLDVEGLCCTEEERTIRSAFSKYPWIHGASFNLASQRITVNYSGSEKDLISILRGAGFPAAVSGNSAQGRRTWLQTHSSALFTALSGICAGIGLLLSAVGIESTVLIALFALSILTGGWRIAVKGWKSALVLTFDMNFLMTIAVIGAMAIGKWTEAAFVVFLFSFAQLLESYSMRKSRKAIQSLLDLSPPEASVVRDGSEERVAVDAVRLGETIVIRPGERFPLDGHVVRGSTTVDQSPITGESMPVRKASGDPVYAGTINHTGTIEVGVSTLARDTTLSHIIHMVEKAQEQRAPSQQMVNRFSHYYTPAVILLSLATVLLPTLLFAQPFSVWFYRALVLLVIACPCALVISTPVSIISGLTRAARDGILIKGGSYLEDASRIRAFAFDKTGTLTQGKLEVTEVVCLNSAPENELLSIASTLESGSEHPFAGTIIAFARSKKDNHDTTPMREFTAIPGRGVSGRIGETRYYLGNHALAEEQSFCSPDLERVIGQMESQGKSIVVLGCTGEALGVIAIADAPREEAEATIADLRRQGIEHFTMLTGDNIHAARTVGTSIGIDDVRGELLPMQKVECVIELKNRFEKVAMVGDGINDAPALAAATVGIAMGAIGSDVAIETADVALMSDDLSKLSELRRLSRRTLRIIKQNIALSILIKVVFLALALIGTATLWMAIAADEGASLVVIANGLRLLRSEKPKSTARDIDLPYLACHTNVIQKV